MIKIWLLGMGAMPLAMSFHAIPPISPIHTLLEKPMIRSARPHLLRPLLSMVPPDNNATPELDVPEPPVMPSPREKALLEAKKLRAQAEQQRLEAEQMATILTLEKIENLEKKAQIIQEKENGGTKEDQSNRASKEQEEEIRNQIELLKRQLKPKEEEKQPMKERPKGVSSYMTTGGPPSFATPSNNGSFPTTTEPANKIPKTLSEMDLKDRIDAFEKFPKEVKELFARAVGASDTSDAKSILVQVHDMEENRKLALEENPGVEIPMDILDIANAQAGFSTLPPPIQSMIAETANMKDCTNQTALMEKLIETKAVKRAEDGEVEFFMGDDDDGFLEEDESPRRDFTAKERKDAVKMFEDLPAPMKVMLKSTSDLRADATSEEVVEELIKKKKMLPSKEGGIEFVLYGDGEEDGGGAKIEGTGYVKSLLPAVTRKMGQTPALDDVNVFFSEVLGKKTFNPFSKPERIPGGYVIRGENKLKTSDDLVSSLDEALQSKSLVNKMQVFYIKDPTLVTEEQFETDTMEQPLLLVTGPDLSPDTNALVKPIVTALGGVSIAAFGIAVCLATESAIPETLYWSEEMVAPLLFAVIGTQIAHEFAHQLVGLKDKFKVGSPTIIPSPQLGLLGCITPLKSSPKNLNSLFDFAIVGPLVGMAISVFLLYIGLEKQVFMDQLSQSQLPSLPIQLVRSSSLAGGMVEWLLGDGALLSPDPTALIRLHPLAIAGFIGIVSNALNLLPLGNTDGGRVSLALFGRSLSNIVRSITVAGMIAAGLFGDDNANLLLVFALYSQIWQRETEIPCKNEVDGIDDFRVVVAFLSFALAGLAIVPLI